jgi:putative glutathione S-transferase
VNGFTLIRQAYDATEPGYDGHISVPVVWDRRTSRIVSNNFPDITIDLETQFGQWATPGVDLYPLALRPEIDALNERVYTDVNNGVYQCGFAATQAAYDAAVARLFTALDDLDRRLATRRYLFGDALTEADVRLWVTLARFDPVYVTHFKANLRRLADYPNLWPYARDLYQQPAFGGTTDFDHIKRHYFGTHRGSTLADRARRTAAGLAGAAPPGASRRLSPPSGRLGRARARSLSGPGGDRLRRAP